MKIDQDYLDQLEAEAVDMRKFQKHTEKLLNLYSFTQKGIKFRATNEVVTDLPLIRVLNSLYFDLLRIDKRIRTLEELLPVQDLCGFPESEPIKFKMNKKG